MPRPPCTEGTSCVGEVGQTGCNGSVYLRTTTCQLLDGSPKARKEPRRDEDRPAEAGVSRRVRLRDSPAGLAFGSGAKDDAATSCSESGSPTAAQGRLRPTTTHGSAFPADHRLPVGVADRRLPGRQQSKKEQAKIKVEV